MEKQAFNLSEYKRNLSANIAKHIEAKQAELQKMQAELQAAQRKARLEAEGKSEFSD